MNLTIAQITSRLLRLESKVLGGAGGDVPNWVHLAGATNWASSGAGAAGFYYSGPTSDGWVDIIFDMLYGGAALGAGSSSVMIAAGSLGLPTNCRPNTIINLPAAGPTANVAGGFLTPQIGTDGSVTILVRGVNGLAANQQLGGVYRYPVVVP